MRGQQNIEKENKGSVRRISRKYLILSDESFKFGYVHGLQKMR